MDKNTRVMRSFSLSKEVAEHISDNYGHSRLASQTIEFLYRDKFMSIESAQKEIEELELKLQAKKDFIESNMYFIEPERKFSTEQLKWVYYNLKIKSSHSARQLYTDFSKCFKEEIDYNIFDKLVERMRRGDYNFKEN